MATKSNVKSVKVKKVKLTIGERELDYVLDLNAFAEIEDIYGSINELMSGIETGSAKAIRAVIWAGLQNNENPPTIKEVGPHISMSIIQGLSLTIAEAMGASLPEKGETDPNA
jgi:hypothetical protein